MSHTLNHDVIKRSLLFPLTTLAEEREIEKKSLGNNGNSVLIRQEVLSHCSLTNV